MIYDHVSLNPGGGMWDYLPKNCAYKMPEYFHASPMAAFAGIFV
jgi:hypothetical protein